jgi:hypothetical protein
MDDLLTPPAGAHQPPRGRAQPAAAAAAASAASVSQFKLLRADDMLEMTVMVAGGLGTVRTADAYELHAVSEGTLTVILPPQHLMEKLLVAPPKYVFSPPTRLIYRVPAGAPPIRLSAAGVLAALPGLELVVDPALGTLDPVPELQAGVPLPAASLVRSAMAAITGDREAGEAQRVPADAYLVDQAQRSGAETAFDEIVASGVLEPLRIALPPQAARRNASAEAIGPGGPLTVNPNTVTELKLSSRLGFTPYGGAMRFVHAAAPVVHGGAVELWHTRLARLTTGGRFEEGSAAIIGLRSSEPTATNSTWASETAGVQMLSLEDRKAVIDQSRQIGRALLGRHVTLSPLGAWSDLNGFWPFAPSLLAWQQHNTMGRTQYERKVVLGSLYPFGHAAVMVSTTERSLAGDNGRFSALSSRSVITVREPFRAFGGTDSVALQWPFVSVELLTTATPEGTFKSISGSAGVIERSSSNATSRPFEFRCRAIDRGAQVVSFDMPLIFVPNNFTDFAGLNSAFAALAAQPLTPYAARLNGQRLSIAQPAPAQPPDGVARPPDGTEVVLQLARLAVSGTSNFRPLFTEMIGRVPGVEHFGAAAGNLAFRFADAYKLHGFGGANTGEVLLQIDGVPPLSLFDAADAGGLMSAMTMATTGLSRKLGPVAGSLASVALEQFDPQDFLGDLLGQMKLFGVFPLGALISAGQGLQAAPHMASKVIDGVRSQRFDWSTPLFSAGTDLIDLGAGRLKPQAGKTAQLAVNVSATVDPVSLDMRAETRCRIDNIALAMGLAGFDLVTVPIDAITFTSRDAQKPDVDVVLGDLTFGGVLAFLAEVATLVEKSGFTDLKAIDLLPDGVKTSFTLPIPAFAVGVFCLENIQFGAALDLPFSGRIPELSLNFASFDNPFTLTVLALGGRGYLGLALNTQGLVRLEGSLEFGAAVSLNLIVAKASVSVMGGIYFSIEGSDALLTGFVRVKGKLDVLSLISVSVELFLGLTYEPADQSLLGKAEIVVKIKLLFLHKTVRVPFEQRFGGSGSALRAASALPDGLTLIDGPPGFLDAMSPPGWIGATPWDVYCTAYA